MRIFCLHKLPVLPIVLGLPVSFAFIDTLAYTSPQVDHGLIPTRAYQRSFGGGRFSLFSFLFSLFSFLFFLRKKNTMKTMKRDILHRNIQKKKKFQDNQAPIIPNPVARP